MSDTSFTYAVARVRSKELGLLSSQNLEQLLSAKSYEECLRLLQDKGWGSADSGLIAEEMLAQEREKTWALMRELVDDMHLFDVFLYTNDYHNLKAAIKLVCTQGEDFGLFISNGSIPYQRILEAVREKEYGWLPSGMAQAAQEAYTTLSQTQDGQLCDVIVDRACLDTIYQAGKDSRSDLIQLYAELTVASADIKTAVRCANTRTVLDLIQRALAPCDTLSVSRLAKAAAEGMESICDYLSATNYAGGVDTLRQSPSAFERWLDDLMIEAIKPQQYQAFGIGPLAAYVLARENEIKTVRIILSGKLNGLPEQVIRERMRQMYV